MHVLADIADDNREIADKITSYAIQEGFDMDGLNLDNDAESILTQDDAIRYIEQTVQAVILWTEEGLILLRMDEREFFAMKHTPLRLLGYRFIARLNEDYIILASYPDHRNYMLFQQVDKRNENLPTFKGRAFEFVKPITQESDPTAYYVAVKEDDKARNKMEGDGE